MNVFEDQRFLLCAQSRDGTKETSFSLSWRELMTLDETQPYSVNGQEISLTNLRFNYPLEYMNTAALGLCTALTQAFFEPVDIDELIQRIATPLEEEAVAAIISQYREEFGIDEGHRFLQGRQPQADKKGRIETEGLDTLLLTVKKGEKEFLNRPATDWGVRLDQIPLFLFSRMTFYEKSAGRGFLTGTSGDLEIRTFLIDPTSLRKSIWLNVLTKEAQENHFIPAKSKKGYDDWMWITPPTNDVPQGAISLRSALLWMVANAWIDIKHCEKPYTCIITGEIIQIGERAGIGCLVKSTGIAYGIQVERDSGPAVRQSFFLHPNGPYKTVVRPKIPPFNAHFSVDETSGLIGVIGGLFYATPFGKSGFHLAPVVDQMYKMFDILQSDYSIDEYPRYMMWCFGFHMLSSKKNVHGGYEAELYEYPILGSGKQGREQAMECAEGILNGCAKNTGHIVNALSRGIQRCMLKETDVSINEQGRLEFTNKSFVNNVSVIQDAARELWIYGGNLLQELLRKIGNYGTDANLLEQQSGTLQDWWSEEIIKAAENIFYRFFNDYSASPQHIMAAHDARRLFYYMLRKDFAGILKNRTSTEEQE